jgi:selenocysteine lyase/cysteine desulfurase
LLEYFDKHRTFFGDFDKTDWQPADSARRFECGSPNMLTIHALHASIGLLLETGMQQVQKQVLSNTRYLIDACAGLEQVEILSDTGDSRLSGIVTFRKASKNMDDMYRWLVDKGVVCAPRGGGIRLSPHFHTPREQLRQLMEWIADY